METLPMVLAVILAIVIGYFFGRLTGGESPRGRR
jgi:hypothetical protein